jgi:alkaline phosphatase D
VNKEPMTIRGNTTRPGLVPMALTALIASIALPAPWPLGKTPAVAQIQDAAPVPAPAGIAPSSRWRTLAETTTLERIAFGSCLDQNKPQPIWQAVRGVRPQLFLMIGDNVYGNVKSAEMNELKEAYAAQAAQAELAEARAAIPFLAVWDDHDYGVSDGGASFAYKAASARLFHEFWQMAREPRDGEGIYYSRIYGPAGKRVQIVMLDTRTFRSNLKPKTADFPYHGKYSPDDDPAKTMLGAAQWAWLEAELRKPAEIRLLVSSVQVLAEGHGKERWGNLPRERDRLLKMIEETKAKGVIILSGDRHAGSFFKTTAGRPYPLVELTSSSLNRPLDPAERGHYHRTPELISDFYFSENFGLITIDWTSAKVRLSLHDVVGKEVAAVSSFETDPH